MRISNGLVRLIGVSALLGGCGAAPDSTGTTPDPAEDTAATGEALAACGVRFVAAGGDAAPSNTCRSLRRPCASIGQAITAACAGDTLLVGPGTFVENVVVSKGVSIAGAGPATVVVPATSAPDPCSDSSLCGGAASNVFFVTAPGVTIASLTVDGDNPALASGVAVGGADVDARSGIITTDAAAVDGLAVLGVTVRNVYLRGIDAASGGAFRFEGNRVTNLSDDPQAIGIFNTGGAGTIADNVVTGVAAAIASNFSRGVTFARNRVTGAGGGIHTDNAGWSSGSTPDAIVDNVIGGCASGGFGAFAFVPSLPVTFRGNRITGCAVGLAAFGSRSGAEVRFTANRIDGAGVDGAVGVYASTSELGFGSGDVSVVVDTNRIVGTAQAVVVDEEADVTATADVRCNVVTGAGGVVTAAAATSVHDNALACTGLGVDAAALGSAALAAPRNWWGCPGGPGAPGCAGASPNVDPDPVAVLPPLCTILAPP